MKLIALNTIKKNPKYGVMYTMVDDEDFEELSKFNWCTMKVGNGLYPVRFTRIGGKGKTTYLHKVVTKTDGGEIIDHKDGNCLNNQKSNLRIVTRSQNRVNSRPRTGCTSKYLGVSLFIDKRWKKQRPRWVAILFKPGKKKIHIGTFDTEEQAALAFNEVALKIHGEYARLNVIE